MTLRKILFFILVGGLLIISLGNFKAPVPRSEMASTKIGKKIYVAGGINFWLSNKKFEEYDIESNTWRKLKNLPTSLNHIGLCSDGNNIFLSGGFLNAKQTKFSDALYVYNPDKDEWEFLSKLPDKRAAHFMIYKENQLHLIGGKKYKEIWTFDLSTERWMTNELPSLPEYRDHISVLKTDSSLYIVGGRNQNGAIEDCWEYNFGDSTWQTFTKLPVPRGGQTSCIFNDEIHVIGGEDLFTKTTYSRHDIYNIKTNIWKEGGSMKTSRHGLISEMDENKWYLHGGGKLANVKTIISCTNELEILNLGF